VFDTAKPYYYMTDLVFNRLQDEEALSRDGIKIYGNRFYLRHPFGLDNPAVFFDLEKREFHIEASLPKLLQGYNVGGSNRLEYMCLQVAKLIYKQLGLCFSRRECREIKHHRIRLGRLDGTIYWLLASEQQIPEIQEAIWEQLRAEGFNWSAYGKFNFETVYNQQHSTRVSDKFYNKYAELLIHKIPACVAEREWILEFARRILRFEVTWRGKELKRLEINGINRELNYADSWSRQILKTKINERLEQFNFQGALEERMATTQINNLNQCCKTFYELWSQGNNLSKHRDYRPLANARDHLLEHHQVDIFRRTGVGCDIPLNEILTIENARVAVPKYLSRRGAAFGFKRPAA